MAYKSKFTGAKIDELLTAFQSQQDDPSSILEGISGDDILSKMTGQQIIDKINTVTGNIVFTKFVECTADAGKANE